MINNVENLIEFIKLNNIGEWQLRSAKQNDPNSYVFKSDATQDRDLEMQRMEKILSFGNYNRLYFSGKPTGGGKTGNYSETLELAPAQTEQHPIPQTIGYTPDDLERRIQQAIDHNNFEWEKRQFEQDKKDFKAAQKEFEEQKQGIFGILVEKAAPIVMPYIQGLLQKRNPMASVAGTPDAVTVPPIKVAEAEEEPAETEEKSPFTEEESDKLFLLMERFKKVEPDFLALIESVVVMAENGDQMYTMAKGMLLKK